MSTRLNPYISFRDTARQAMEFYRSIFGGRLDFTTFEDFHASEDLAERSKIMHGMLVTEGGLTIMGADIPNAMEHNPGDSMSISLSGEDEAELRRYWAGLSDGGDVAMPLEKAPWGDTFGMCVDRFGVRWLVNITCGRLPGG